MRIMAGLLLATCSSAAAGADNVLEDVSRLGDLSLEQLAEIRVTSVSLREEAITEASASIYVITAEAIRRSGVTTIPEALRLAPNLQVARGSAAAYSITARGLSTAGNKLQVLIDGRIVYSPLYSGVLWDAQDVVMEDIDRIEVISGPGGALWGSNAVNGVINIITRRTRDTRDTLLSLSGGDQDRRGALRVGGTIGSANYRVYVKGFDLSNTETSIGAPVQDDQVRTQGGFRIGWGKPGQGFTLQGDAYQGRSGQASPPGYQHIAGANLLSRWTGPIFNGDQLRVQAYYDQTERKAPGPLGEFSERLKIVDLSFQHNINGIAGHGLVWGAGFRGMRDDLTNYPTLAYLPDLKMMNYASIFAQDEVAITSTVGATLGAKVERNPYTGVEVMPSLRFDWRFVPGQIAWTALSRAVRTPSRLDRELFAPAVPLAPPLPPHIIAGGPGFQSEVSEVMEVGYRVQHARFTYSATIFHHRYDRLRSVEILTDPAYTSPFIEVQNKMDGHANGVEMWGTWQVMRGWRLEAGGTYLDQRLKLKAGSTDPTGVSAAGNDPRYQAMLRSSMDLPGNVSLDVGVRHVAELPNPVVAAYTAVDARLGWRASSDVELALVMQNLFDPGHVEFVAVPGGSEIPRAYSVQVRMRF